MGNPKQKAYYDYMLSYSPYDQLRRTSYPAMLVTTGLWDSQVTYWEPAKYVAKIRTLDASPSPVLLRVNMEAGHGGRSGRFTRLEQVALEYAFILMQLRPERTSRHASGSRAAISVSGRSCGPSGPGRQSRWA